MLQLYEEFNSLGEMFRKSARKYPDKPAVIFQGKTSSYALMEYFSNKTANFLAEKGIGRGKNVGLYCINSPWFVAAYFGILKTGATVVPVNLLLSPEEILYILHDSRAAGLIYSDIFENNVSKVKNSLPGLSFLVASGKPCIPGALPFSKILEEGNPDFNIPKLEQKQDVAAILYTSGTTGVPKGAMLTHGNLLFNVNSILKILTVDETDVFLTVLPMFHAFGATAGMITPIAAGATVSAVPKFIPADVMQTICDTRATIFLGVPAMYRLLADLPENFSCGDLKLRFCVSGGDALPTETMKSFEDRYGILIYEGDGPTECSPVTAVNPIGGKRKPCSIGIPVPGVHMKIADENGDELKNGQIGEIVVKGESVMKGYFKMEKETAESFFRDWFRTGDLGYRDDENYFYIVDRKKDMIIVNGMNVYPRMVENVICRHSAVSEAAVVPQPHKLHGEIPRAVIVLRPGEKTSKKEILRFCSEHLGRHEIPRVIEFVEELPKTPTGKVLKRLLRSGKNPGMGYL
ncbi:MAG TPA: long-chain fatty acid--CoA ligase [bacterium]|nr:long-chain fatty acid--CoA ligase [bacterium]